MIPMKSVVDVAKALVASYNPNQPRDKEGQWTRYGSGFGGPSAHPDTRVTPTSSLTLEDFTDRERLREVVKTIWGPGATVKRVMGAREGSEYVDVEVTGEITNKFGDVVGRYNRKLTYFKGEINADHTYLGIDEVYQGRGIGSQWNARAVEQYRKLGVSYVTIHAGESIGGYTWAREGFRAHGRWHQDTAAGSRAVMGEVMKQANSKLRQMHAEGKISDEHFKKARREMSALKKAIDAGEDVQPIHVASVGESTMRFRAETAQGASYETWPGKEALIGSDWTGIYYFDARDVLTAAAMICEHGSFACYEAACRPPTSGGTGGSSPKGGKAKARSAPVADAPVTEFGRRIRDAIANDPDLAPLTGSGRAKLKEEATAHDRLRDTQYLQEIYGPDTETNKRPRDTVLPRSFNVFVDPSKMNPSSGLIEDPAVRESHERVREAINNAHNIRQSDYVPRNAEEQMIKDLITKRLTEDPYEEVRVSNEYGIGVTVWAQVKRGWTPEVWSSTEQAVNKVGRMIDDEINSRFESRFDGEAVKTRHEAALARAVEIARKDQPDVTLDDFQIMKTSDGEIHVSLFVTDSMRASQPTLQQIRENPALANVPAAKYNPAMLEELRQHIVRSGVQSKSVANQIIAERAKLHGDVIDEVLSEVRPMGGEHAGTPRHREPKYKGSLSTHEQVTGAIAKYPRDWIEASSADRELVFRQTNGRAHYRHMKAKGSKAVSELTLDGTIPTAIHEFAHRMEATVPSLLQLERVFYDRRTAGDSLKRMGRGYGKDEVTREDEFFRPYVGKDYKGRAYEIMSMGYEYLRQRTSYDKIDPDYRAFVLGALATTYRLDL